MRVERKKLEWVIFRLSAKDFKEALELPPEVRLVSVSLTLGAKDVEIYTKDES